MSNYKDFLIGAGGGAYTAPYDQTWTLVDQASGYIYNSNYTKQSSTTYQSFHRLAVEGLYGGLFDPYDQNNNGRVVARSFSVNQSTGAINVNSGTDLWSHSYGEVFSTCQHSAIGNTVMNIGHHKNPSYGSTNKGWIWAAEFNDAGAVENHGNSQAPIEAWPHSNGDLLMCATARKDGTVYGRRSTYNSNSSSRYWHSRGYSSNGSVSYNEWSNISSSTSTNYAFPAAAQDKFQLNRGGIISYYNSSSVGKFSVCYGSQADRGTEYDTSTYWGSDPTSDVKGFCLSNGETLWISNQSKVFKSNNGNGSVTALSGSSYPNGAALLKPIQNGGSYQNKMCIPLGNDTWIYPLSGSQGWIRLSIDVNNGYEVSADYIYSGLLTPQGSNPTSSGTSYDVTGPNGEYFVISQVNQGYYTISVYNNPFYGV
jgi:hypothetical protein